VSQRNVEILRRAYDAFSRGDFDAIVNLSAEDFELDMSRWGPVTYTYRGPEGLREFLATLERLWDYFKIEPEEFVDAGDKVVVIIDVEARGGASGIKVRARYANTYTFRGDGKVVRAEWFDQPAEALAVVGLPAYRV
jgi:ketosteroid isomerase-like protein